MSKELVEDRGEKSGRDFTVRPVGEFLASPFGRGARAGGLCCGFCDFDSSARICVRRVSDGGDVTGRRRGLFLHRQCCLQFVWNRDG